MTHHFLTPPGHRMFPLSSSLRAPDAARSFSSVGELSLEVGHWEWGPLPAAPAPTPGLPPPGIEVCSLGLQPEHDKDILQGLGAPPGRASVQAVGLPAGLLI